MIEFCLGDGNGIASVKCNALGAELGDQMTARFV